MPVAVATGIILYARPQRAYRFTGTQGWDVYGGTGGQGRSEPAPGVLWPGPCVALLTGLVPAAGPPPAVTPLGRAPTVLPAAPAAEPLCAQAINDVPARNATATAAR
jgi:hypothetical protein